MFWAKREGEDKVFARAEWWNSFLGSLERSWSGCSGLNPCRELAPAMTTRQCCPRAGDQSLELGFWHCTAFHTSNQSTHTTRSEVLWPSRTGYGPSTETSNRGGGKKCITSVVKGGQDKARNQPQTHNNAIPVRWGGFGEPNERSTNLCFFCASRNSPRLCRCRPACAESGHNSSLLLQITSMEVHPSIISFLIHYKWETFYLTENMF